MKRFLLGLVTLVVLLGGSFLFQTSASFAQTITKTAPAENAEGHLRGVIWESSSELAFSVGDITTGNGSLQVDIGGGGLPSDVVGGTFFQADRNGYATGDVPVGGGYCTNLSVRVYDGQAGTDYTISIPPCTAVNSDPITQKWIALGGTGFLGYPATRENQIKPGLYQHFAGGSTGGGSIYWSPSTGAHEVHGLIRGEWASLGWEQSFLGFPVTDETPTPNGPHGPGRYNHFQGGSIYWSPSTGAHEVHGLIRNYWASRGWEQSCFGYPTSDEQPSGSNARISWFQIGNWISWSPTSGISSSC